MDNDKKKEAQDMATEFREGETQKEVEEIKNSDPLESLKLNLFKFFENRITAIQEEGEFKEEVKGALREKINDGELSASQLIQLLNATNDADTQAMAVLLDVFKPTKDGAVSPLVRERQNRGDEDLGSMNKELTPEEHDNVNKLANLINQMNNGDKDSKE